jgi:hypothetical protein
MSGAKQPKQPVGQKRPRGRPELDESERLVQRSIRLLRRHWAKIDFAGLEALRTYLDRWQPKPPPDPKEEVGRGKK